MNKSNISLVNSEEEKVMNKKKKKGFTLIELIVVIAILGILAAVAIPRFAGIQTNAKNQAMKTTATTILNAAEAMYQATNADVPAGTGSDTTLIGGLVQANYLRTGNYTGFTLTKVSSGIYSVTYTDSNGGQTIN